jgi:hypothetical protein
VLRGFVRSTSGIPVEGVTVYATPKDRSLRAQFRGPDTTTDDQGRWVLPVDTSMDYWLAAGGQKYLHSFVDGTSIDPGRVVDLVVEPPPELVIVVTDEAGVGVRHAQVHIAPTPGRPTAGRPGPEDAGFGSATMPTDERGELSYRFPDRGAVIVQAIQRESSLRGDPVRLETPTGRVNIVLRPASRAVVRVMDSRTREPVRGYRLEFRDERTGATIYWNRTIETEKGPAVDWLGQGPYLLSVRREGYRAWEGRASFARPGSTVEVEAALDAE